MTTKGSKKIGRSLAKRPTRVFLSYDFRDKEDVGMFLPYLAPLRSNWDSLIDLWCFEEQQLPSNWKEVVTAKLHDCELFLAFWTEYFWDSANCAFEFQEFCKCNPTNHTSKIVPIHWRFCEIPASQSHRVYTPLGPPVTSRSPVEQQQACLEVVQFIKKAL